jgi:hypothetical protein
LTTFCGHGRRPEIIATEVSRPILRGLACFPYRLVEEKVVGLSYASLKV